MYINLTWNWHSLCGSGILLFAVRVLGKPYNSGVNWPTTLFENKDRIHFFTLKSECHNRYNKLLLCNSENGDIAWYNKKNSQWGFCVFLKKNKNLFLFKKNKKNRIKKNKKEVGCFSKVWFFSTPVVFQSFLWFSLDRTILKVTSLSICLGVRRTLRARAFQPLKDRPHFFVQQKFHSHN